MSQDTLKYDDAKGSRSSSPIKRSPSPVEKRIMTKSSSGRFRTRSPPPETVKASQPSAISSEENKSRRNSSAPKAAEQEHQRQKPTAKKKFGLFFMGHSACQ